MTMKRFRTNSIAASALHIKKDKLLIAHLEYHGCLLLEASTDIHIPPCDDSWYLELRLLHRKLQ
jgi:hypothetical protein